jgi:hypothetical protein
MEAVALNDAGMLSGAFTLVFPMRCTSWKKRTGLRDPEAGCSLADSIPEMLIGNQMTGTTIEASNTHRRCSRPKLLFQREILHKDLMVCKRERMLDSKSRNTYSN